MLAVTLLYTVMTVIADVEKILVDQHVRESFKDLGIIPGSALSWAWCISSFCSYFFSHAQ